jgi:hypothetical protein
MDVVVVEVDAMRVNHLIPFGHHRHYLEITTWARESMSDGLQSEALNLRLGLLDVGADRGTLVS